MRASSRERLVFETRRHGIVLAADFAKAALLCGTGLALLKVGWFASIPAALLLVAAAWVAIRAVLSWDRTRLSLTDQKLSIAAGVLRRQSASVRLAQAGPIEIEQTLTGRLLHYGTVIAGDLEVDYVPHPRDLHDRLERVGH